jgi:hypothetical protein
MAGCGDDPPPPVAAIRATLVPPLEPDSAQPGIRILDLAFTGDVEGAIALLRSAAEGPTESLRITSLTSATMLDVPSGAIVSPNYLIMARTDALAAFADEVADQIRELRRRGDPEADCLCTAMDRYLAANRQPGEIGLVSVAVGAILAEWRDLCPGP